MLKLMKYLKKYWVYTLLAPLFMALEVCADLLQPKFMSKIVDVGIASGNAAYTFQMTGIMVLVAMAGVIGGVGCTIFSTLASQNFALDLRHDLFKKVQTFSFKNLDTFSAGSLITRLTNDVTQVQNIVLMMLRMMVRAPLLSIGSLIMALAINLKLGVILVVSIPLLFVLLGFVMKKAFPIFSVSQKKLDKVNNVMQENLSGIRVVKAFVREDYEKERFEKANLDLKNITLKGMRLMAISMPLMMLVMNLSTVAILWYGGPLSWQGSLTTGELIAFINYITQVLFSLMMVAFILVFWSRAKASSDRINEVLRAEPDIENIPHAIEGGVQKGEVRFDNVSFSYASNKDTEVLENISFTAKPGSLTAIIGGTGSGKSTLISLIPRLYDTTEGNVYIDGKNVRDYDLNSLRGSIGMVLQDTILFSGTIKDNICFGRLDATLEEAIASAKIAQAHDFIEKLPEGYNTMLGQRGVNLSGGQKQRIAIARALTVNPKILILDDSTSAVDLATEAKIQKQMKEKLKNATSFVVAQRISSVMEADKIIVLDEGRIAAIGTHEELMEACGIYQEIYRSQVGKVVG